MTKKIINEIKGLLVYRTPNPNGKEYRRGYKAGWTKANRNKDKILKLINKLELDHLNDN